MKILLPFTLFFLCLCLGCQKNEQNLTINALAKPVFDDPYPNRIMEADLDSLYDLFFMEFPYRFGKMARVRFEKQLDSLLKNPLAHKMDLVKVYRRLAVLNIQERNTLKASKPTALQNAQKSFDLIQTIPSADPEELAKTYTVYVLAHCYEYQIEKIPALLPLMDKAIDIMEAKYGKEHIKSLIFHALKGIAYHFMDDAEIPMNEYTYALKTAARLPQSYPAVEAQILLRAGTTANWRNQPDSYLYMEKSLSKIPPQYGDDFPLYEKNYWELWVNNYKTNQEEMAEQYIRLAYELSQRCYIPNHFSIDKRAEVYANYLSDEQSLPVYERMAANTSSLMYPDALAYYAIKSSFVKTVGIEAKRRDYLRKAFKGTLDIVSVKPVLAIEVGRFISGFSRLNKILKLQMGKEALVFMRAYEAISSKDSTGGSTDPLPAIDRIYLAAKCGYVEEADVCYQKLKRFPILNGKMDGGREENSLKAFSTFNALFAKLTIEQERYKRSHSPKDSIELMRYVQLTKTSLDSMKLKSWSHTFSNMGMEPVEACIDIETNFGHYDAAFQWAENNRIMKLTDEYRTRSAVFLPEHLQKQKRKLQKELVALTENLFNNRFTADTTSIHKLEGQCVLKKQELSSFELNVKKKYADSLHSNQNQPLANTQTIQQKILNDQTALIEYFVSDTTIVVFTLSKTGLKVEKVKKPLDFDDQINDLTIGLTNATQNPFFAQRSAAMYDLILRGAIAGLPKEVNNLVIVPDGKLSYLPFEMLIKETLPHTEGGRSFQKYRYLLQEGYTISYAYSANLLLEQKKERSEKAPQFLAAFAPQYHNQDTLLQAQTELASRSTLTRIGAYELPGARSEVESIGKITGGKTFFGMDADESHFKREAGHYRVLHCAMHAISDNKNPQYSRLLLTKNPKDTLNNGDLTASELYAMSLKADLVVLSACNTGNGNIQRGEGVMSLSRAFAYTGVPATVMSLWRVPDMPTKEIMIHFYENLKAGQTKDAALQNAKLQYLDNCKDDFAANPYNWAGFVAVGNMDMVAMPQPVNIQAFVAIFVILIVLIYWLGKRYAFPKV